MLAINYWGKSMPFLINCKDIVIKYVIFPFLILNAQLVFANHSQVSIENIDLRKHGVLIKFSGKASFQTIQIDGNQILIALKDVLSGSAIDKSIKKSELIKQISFDKMACGVTALIVYTNKDVRSYSSKWLENENSLVVNFVKI